MALRSSVVGAGVVSETHLSALERNPRTELVAICDVDRSKAMDVARDYGIDHYVDVDDMLESESLDWVHICTPVATHADLARRVIETGVPVMIEKPITETSEELDGLLATAEAHGVPVSSVHNHVFDPAMRKALGRIESGALGDIRGVDLLYTGETKPNEQMRGSWAFDLPGGELEEGLPHPLYLALAAGGYPASEDDVQVLTSLADSYVQDFTYDSAQMQYRTGTGALCSIKILSGGIPQRLLHVHGERESLVADLVSQTVVRVPRDYTASSIARARNNVDRAIDRFVGTAENVQAVLDDRFRGDWETAKRVDSHYYQIDLEATALLTGDELPIPVEQIRWTIRLMELLREAAENEARPVDSTVEQSQ